MTKFDASTTVGESISGLEAGLPRRRFLSLTSGAFAAAVSACSEQTDTLDTRTSEGAAAEAALAGDVFTPQRTVFAGLWKPSTATQLLTLNRNYSQFVDEYGRRSSEGLLVTSITSSLVNGSVVHSAIWGSGSGGQHVDLERTAAQFTSVNTTWTNKGYRLVSLSTVTVNGEILYNGVWNPSTATQFLALGKTEGEFLSEYRTRYDSGYKLAAIATNLIGGQVRYTGFWNANSSGQYFRIAKTRDQFIAEDNTRKAGGYRLVGLSTYVSNESVYYAGIWNPGTYDTFLGLDRPDAQLLSDYSTQWDAGMRLAAFSSDHVEALALNRAANRIRELLGTSTSGFGATVAHGTLRARSFGGVARTQSDGPRELAFSSGTRVNAASACKTFTAIGVLQVLKAKGLTPSTKIAAYLPTGWTKGPGVADVTFGEVMTHVSGFRGVNGDANSFVDIKAMILAGVTGSKSFSYQNQNYALLAFMVPYMNGFTGAGLTDAQKELEASRLFLEYMNNKVFRAAGIPSVSGLPVPLGALYYPFPINGQPGRDFGDFSTRLGWAGYHLSSDDIATVLVKLRDGTLLDAAWNEIMNSGTYGWFNQKPTTHFVRHGYAFRHPGQYGRIESGQVNTVTASFPDGTQIGIVVNSVCTSSSPTNAAFQAYEQSWVPIQ